MAVTRLKRKTAKNKITAKKRVADLKRLQTKLNIKSPYKEISGIILEDQESTLVVEKSTPVTSAEVVKESSQEEE